MLQAGINRMGVIHLSKGGVEAKAAGLAGFESSLFTIQLKHILNLNTKVRGHF